MVRIEVAPVVSFAERADCREVRNCVIVLAPLVELVELVEFVALDEPGALDKSVATTLSASEVSPDCKSPLMSDRALESGFWPEAEPPPSPPLPPIPGGGFWEI